MVHRSSVSIFNSKKRKAIIDWKIVNDDVMGGNSKSIIYLSKEGFTAFEGEISLDNNEGFSMAKYNCNFTSIKNYNSIILKLVGDGSIYQFRIKDSLKNQYSYTQKFKTTGKLQTVELVLKDFYPIYRGKKLPFENFDKNNIEQVAFLIGNKR